MSVSEPPGNNETAYAKLNEILSKAKKIHPEASIFGTFLKQDGSVVAVIIPALDDICLCGNFIKETIEDILFEDIRLFNFNESTDYCIINPKYIFLYETISDKTLLVKRTLQRSFYEIDSPIYFIQQLSSMERRAVDEILSITGVEGIFKPDDIVAETGISRLALSNLLSKMNNNEIAEIVYLGKQGIYIKLAEDCLLGIRGTYSKKGVNNEKF